MSAQTYAALTAREKRRERIDGALADALRDSVRQTYLYVKVATLDGDTERVARLRQARRAIMDVYRIARESVDG